MTVARTLAYSLLYWLGVIPVWCLKYFPKNGLVWEIQAIGNLLHVHG